MILDLPHPCIYQRERKGTEERVVETGEGRLLKSRKKKLFGDAKPGSREQRQCKEPHSSSSFRLLYRAISGQPELVFSTLSYQLRAQEQPGLGV